MVCHIICLNTSTLFTRKQIYLYNVSSRVVKVVERTEMETRNSRVAQANSIRHFGIAMGLEGAELIEYCKAELEKIRLAESEERIRRIQSEYEERIRIVEMNARHVSKKGDMREDEQRQREDDKKQRQGEIEQEKNKIGAKSQADKQKEEVRENNKTDDMDCPENLFGVASIYCEDPYLTNGVYRVSQQSAGYFHYFKYDNPKKPAYSVRYKGNMIHESNEDIVDTVGDIYDISTGNNVVKTVDADKNKKVIDKLNHDLEDSHNLISELRSELSVKERELEKQKKTISELESTLCRVQSKLTELEREGEESKTKLEKMEVVSKNLKLKISKADNLIAKRDTENSILLKIIREKIDKLADMDVKLNITSQNITVLSKTVAEKDSLLENLQKELKEKDVENIIIKERLARREEENYELIRNLTFKEEDIAELWRIIVEKEENICKIRVEKDEKIAELNLKLIKQDADIAGMLHENNKMLKRVVEKDYEILNFNKLLTEKKQHVVKNHQELRKEEVDLSILTTRLARSKETMTHTNSLEPPARGQDQFRFCSAEWRVGEMNWGVTEARHVETGGKGVRRSSRRSTGGLFEFVNTDDRVGTIRSNYGDQKTKLGNGLPLLLTFVMITGCLWKIWMIFMGERGWFSHVLMYTTCNLIALLGQAGKFEWGQGDSNTSCGIIPRMNRVMWEGPCKLGFEKIVCCNAYYGNYGCFLLVMGDKRMIPPSEKLLRHFILSLFIAVCSVYVFYDFTSFIL